MTIKSLVEKLKTLLNDDNETVENEEVTLIEIPTLYNDECGPDLAYVAEYNKLSKEEVIKIHTGTDYLVLYAWLYAWFYLFRWNV